MEEETAALEVPSESNQMGKNNDDASLTKPQKNTTWKNRTRMAWLSLIAMVGATAALFWVNDAGIIEQLGSALSWFYVSAGSIVGAYMGFKAWSTIKGK